jgi:4-amino-4-deoxy-L-arabinose transferase-like glycosyltransferase
LTTRLFSNRIFFFLFSLLGLAYIIGLFVPLMDNDSAHHANIALHMYLNRDYVNLIDAGKDYLDKPHLLFWLCAFSYKIFGVTTFAYKLPSFLFTMVGTYSTYRLGKALYNKEVGKLSALFVSSAFAYMLANNDVRMDAILTACVALASWQGVEFINRRRTANAIGLALALALGFDTKGHIAVFTPAFGLFCYILFRKDWKIFWNWKWLVVLICFGSFIFPVVYCYYLQYNLHPEKIVRGQNNINGVKFILFGQSIERLRGQNFGERVNSDYLFFFHSFVWAFAPWSALAYLALIYRLRYFLRRRDEWLSPATFVSIALVLAFSGFKLPHYLNIIFPATAVMTASWMLITSLRPKVIYLVQVVVSFLILILTTLIDAWAFPVANPLILVGTVLLLAVVFYFLNNKQMTYVQKSITVSVASGALCFFLLNGNFYPQLLKYQGGNELASKIKGNVDPVNVYFWKDNYSSSFNFYTATERKQFDDSLLVRGKKPIWLLFDARNLQEIKKAGYDIGLTYSSVDYGVSRLSLKFINPYKRKEELSELVVGEISRRP